MSIKPFDSNVEVVLMKCTMILELTFRSIVVLSLLGGIAGSWVTKTCADDTGYAGAASANQPGLQVGGLVSQSEDASDEKNGSADESEANANEPRQPWTLMSIFDDACGQNCLKDKGLTIAGWSQIGYASAPDGSFIGNGPYLDDKEWGNLNLNQMYLYAAKVADGSKGFDWGFRADLVYGVDGNEAQAFGNQPGNWDYLNGWDHGIYEWAMPQLYAEVAFGDFAVKAGHFYTPHGYEALTAPDNFFFSKQLNFWNSEPVSHTGVQGTCKVNDKLSVLAHWVLGWDTGYNQFGGGNMGTGGFTYTFSENTSLIYTSGFGDFGWRGDGTLNCVVLSHKWNEKWTTVHQFDILQTNLDSDLADPASLIAGNSHGLINYAFYQLTEKAKAGVRYEWYKADGVSYNEFTYGVNYQVSQNIVVRPEMRHNWAPANDVSPWNQNIFGVDAIVKF